MVRCRSSTLIKRNLRLQLIIQITMIKKKKIECQLNYEFTIRAIIFKCVLIK